MSERTLQIVNTTRSRLRAAGRRILLNRVLTGVAYLAAAAALVWFVAAGIEAVFWTSTYVRGAILIAAGAGLVALFALAVLVPLLRLSGVVSAPSPEDVARRVEVAVPTTRDRLLAFLHLAGGKHTASPEEIVDEALQALYEPFSSAPFEPVETFESSRRVLRLSLVPLAALAIFAAAAPKPFFDASGRLLQPMTAFARPAPFSISVSPGDAEILRGDSFEITVEVTGEDAPAPRVEIRRSAESVESEPAGTGSEAGPGTTRFRMSQENVRREFNYRAVAGPVASPWYRVSILDRPVIQRLMVTVSNPAYSRIGRVNLDPNVGDVTALPGSYVDIALSLGGGATAAADLVFDDTKRVPMSVQDTEATARFRLTREGSYHVELIGPGGITNENAIEYRLQLSDDAPPSVTVTVPDLVFELLEPFETNLSARITDDFGFSKAALFFRLSDSRFGNIEETFRESELELATPFELDQVIDHLWNVSDSFAPVPGDVIEYFVRVWDNDSFSGFKSADSRLHRLVVPSLADQYRELNESTDEAADKIEEFIESADDIGERFRELRNELQQKPESDWDDERQLQQIQGLQENLEQEVENVSSGLQDLAEQMQDNNLVSPETLEMFEQLQKAIDEINSPELMDALNRLRESMQNLDLQQMQQSMNDFEFNEEQFKERLKRALDLFKRLQVTQGLEEAARRAEELAKLQEELREATNELTERKESDAQPTDADAPSKTDQVEGENETGEQKGADDEERDPSDRSGDLRDTQRNELERLAGEQERSESEMRDLEKRLEELQKMMDELPRTGAEQMEELRDDLQQQNLPGQMQENAEQLRNQQMQPAMEGQQQLEQQLSRLQHQLSEMQQNMRGNQLQLNIAGLRQVLNDILVLSQQQERTRNDVSDTEADSPALRRFAREQIELGEGLRVVSDTLQKLSREIPEMSRQVQSETGQALREIQMATESLADRSARRAAGHQKASMMHLNELALLLSDLLNMLMNQQMGMGMPSMQQMLQQLQQMSGQQQQLNDQIQQMLNDLQGQRLSSDVQARMRQLAEQQARIREQLKELSRNPELRGKALGDLNKIAEQMEESIRQLEHSRVNRELIERQQQILTRLLDASRSINQRGKEDRRESRTGEDSDRDSPPELSPEERANELRRDLIRALESGYAPDYEELIRRYFQLLQEGSEPIESN